jgi:hypothetical protein
LEHLFLKIKFYIGHNLGVANFEQKPNV